MANEEQYDWYDADGDVTRYLLDPTTDIAMFSEPPVVRARRRRHRVPSHAGDSRRRAGVARSGPDLAIRSLLSSASGEDASRRPAAATSSSAGGTGSPLG
ncbi:Os08g0294900 [Oryza sativa Japonica Group]|uniref:Os08g0294900 protein n=1 Tax=Oryza sativa subsp. japonica TaxID=39947 RepID=A0A0P0XEA2_ORYSJ|nr:Os08g0294900 [Oryza sativa Japonica Group]